MPHKHRRDQKKNDASYYDLPPLKRAKPLPVKGTTTTETTKPPKKSAKRKRANLDDDTPRAFSRLLTAYRPPRSGLDDGRLPPKKRKTSEPTVGSEPPFQPSSIPPPTIQPHEPLSSFNARVDAALPFSGVSKRSGGGDEAERGRKTKTEKKMQKMQKEWREEDKRRKERLDEMKDDAVDDTRVVKKPTRKGGRGKKDRGADGEEAFDADEDPWAHIAAKRAEETNEKANAGLVGLHDVVMAPPKLPKTPKKQENVGVSRGPGGVKRQAELSEARKSVIDSYREMMKQKRATTG